MINIDFVKENRNYNLKAKIVKNESLIKFMDFNYFTELCKNRCPNYNRSWSCPPNSPPFDEYSSNFESSLVIGLRSSLNNESIMEVHPLLRDILTPILRKLQDKFNGLITDGGTCRFCNECAYIHNKPCYKPYSMRYSMEAMGVDLEKLSNELFNISLSWDGNSDETQYCTAISSILFNGNYSEYQFRNALLG